MRHRSATRTEHHMFNLRRQLVYRLTNGPTEVVQSLSIRPSIKRSTDIGAVQPKINVVLFIDHRILVEGQRETRCLRIGRNILWSWSARH